LERIDLCFFRERDEIRGESFTERELWQGIPLLPHDQPPDDQ
jgi:hypothetical protein